MSLGSEATRDEVELALWKSACMYWSCMMLRNALCTPIAIPRVSGQTVYYCLYSAVLEVYETTKHWWRANHNNDIIIPAL